MTYFKQPQTYPILRLNVIWIIFAVIFSIVFLRLFYLQIIKHDEFLAQAKATQIKSLEIEAKRGSIYAFNNNRRVPLVINQRRWTMFSDANFIDDLDGLILNLSSLGIDLTASQRAELAAGSRYTVLQRGVTDSERGELIANLDHRGVYFQQQAIRQYPEGSLASQVLGFLNRDSIGQYGIEQYYHQQLTGTPGRLRTTTDVHDIPLLFIEDNILIEPQPGQDVTLTIDVPLQRIVETQLQAGIEASSGKGGTAIILDAQSGAVLAMANNPSFDPADFQQTVDISHYTNDAVESILEPASILKVLVMAAALNEGAINVDDNYYNPKFQLIDGIPINNLSYRGEGYLPVTEILERSLNTGSIEMLKRLGEGGLPSTIDEADRRALYKYYSQNFRLSEPTGIGLPNEVVGSINPPDHPWAPNHLYATMTFGQSITATPLQLVAAYAAIFNGGDYYQPYITAQVGDVVTSPKLLKKGILKPQAIEDLRSLMVQMAEKNLQPVQYDQLEVSAKTGSAQVVDFVNGGYIEGASTGLMAGYIKNDRQTLAIIVIIEEPQVEVAGYYGARPVWLEIVKSIVALGRVSR